MAEESLDLGVNIAFEVHIHPLVLAQIMDFYYRKYGVANSDDKDKTIVAGSLFGNVFTNRVHVTNCYAISVDQDDEDYTLNVEEEQKRLFEAHFYSHPNEILLGAFVTSRDLEVDLGVAYLSTEFAKKDNGFMESAVLNQPIILKVNPTLESKQLQMRAFKLNQSLKHFAAVASFNQLPVKVSFLDESLEQVIPFLPNGINQKDFRIVNVASPAQSTAQLTKNLDKTLQYIEAVISGKESGDQEFGRKLLQTLNKIDSLKSDHQLHNLIEEAQLFQFLANFTLGQTMVSEKLSKL